MSHLIWIYTVCHSVLDYVLTPLFLTMDMQKVKRWKSPTPKLRVERVKGHTLFCFQVAAKAEADDNELEQKRQQGKKVLYGQVIQVGESEREMIKPALKTTSVKWPPLFIDFVKMYTPGKK